jgi:hypothetical protein
MGIRKIRSKPKATLRRNKVTRPTSVGRVKTRSMMTLRVPRAPDSTVQKLNPGRDRIARMVKSTVFNVNNSGSVYASGNGFGFNLGAAAITWGQRSMIFDPSGTFGNNGGPITASSTVLLGQAIKDWSALASLYSHYKVTKITLKFQASSTINLDTQSPTMCVRYNNEFLAPGVGSATPTTMAEERGWIKKVFTAEHPNFSYSFYPKVMQLVDNIGTTGETRISRAMPFTNIATPVELYGCKVFLNWPGATGSSQVYINCDICYHLQFKEQS